MGGPSRIAFELLLEGSRSCCDSRMRGDSACAAFGCAADQVCQACTIASSIRWAGSDVANAPGSLFRDVESKGVLSGIGSPRRSRLWTSEAVRVEPERVSWEMVVRVSTRVIVHRACAFGVSVGPAVASRYRAHGMRRGVTRPGLVRFKRQPRLPLPGFAHPPDPFRFITRFVLTVWNGSSPCARVNSREA